MISGSGGPPFRPGGAAPGPGPPGCHGGGCWAGGAPPGAPHCGCGGTAEVPGRQIAAVRVLRHRPLDYVLELRRDLVASGGRDRRRGLLHVGPDLGRLGVARVGDVAGERLVEDATERVDVGAGVDLLALELLGRDVVERADEHAGLRETALRSLVLREPEVGEICVPLSVAARD